MCVLLYHLLLCGAPEHKTAGGLGGEQPHNTGAGQIFDDFESILGYGGTKLE